MDGEIPAAIDDSEHIVRAIMVPMHINEKNGKLRPAAFRPAPDTDLVSVMRASYLSADQCKAHARNAENEKAKFTGFAKIVAVQVRGCGSRLEDHREDFIGHAHIAHGIASPPRGEALPPEVLKRLDEKLKCLVSKARFANDPDIAAVAWTGEDLCSS